MQQEKGTGKRFNSNKTKHHLTPAFTQEQYAKVLTAGAEKYGNHNWQKGMSWSTVIDSLKRHLNAIENCEDYDKETGLLHSAHIMCNAGFLTEYYNIYPEGDDRIHWFKKPLKNVFLDLDGVVVDFEQYFLNYLKLPSDKPTDWNDFRFRKYIKEVKNNDEFWLNCPKLIEPTDITYPIKGYCTARNCSTEIVEQWLENNGFPYGEIVNVGIDGDKVKTLKELGCDVMVDDSIYNFMNLQQNGILCYLMSRPHNIKYDVGMYRVNNFEEFIGKVKNLS